MGLGAEAEISLLEVEAVSGTDNEEVIRQDTTKVEAEIIQVATLLRRRIE